MSEKVNYKAFDDGGSDELLRKSMEGYRVEPSPGLWKGISRKLLWKELIHFNFTNISPKTWIGGALGVILVGTMLYLGFNNGVADQPSVTSSPIVHRGASDVRSVPAAHPANLQAGHSQPGNMKQVGAMHSTTSSAGETASSSLPGSAGRRHMPVKAVDGKSASAAWPVAEFSSNEPGAQPLDSRISEAPAALPGITPVLPLEADLTALPGGPDSIITIRNQSGIMKFRKSTLPAGRFFSANLGVTPEVSFYKQPDSYSKLNVWLNGGITWHISRFSVAAGLGLGYVYDEGKYRVEYKSKDSVGYYFGVTSFSVGSANEIIYTTQTIKVYDSLQHLADYRTKNRYSYLQVPLLFGYRFFETNRISMTFEAGPAMSLLLGSRKSDPVIEYSNATIIRVDDNTPDRVKVNWQVWTNLYFEMRMNKQISFYLEPSFKYYLKPVTEQENVTYSAPWTLGLGVGVQFNFGQKTTKP